MWFVVVVVVVAAPSSPCFKVIYFASPAEVLFDDAGQLQASKDGLVSATWLAPSLWGRHAWRIIPVVGHG